MRSLLARPHPTARTIWWQLELGARPPKDDGALPRQLLRGRRSKTRAFAKLGSTAVRPENELAFFFFPPLAPDSGKAEAMALRVRLHTTPSSTFAALAPCAAAPLSWSWSWIQAARQTIPTKKLREAHFIGPGPRHHAAGEPLDALNWSTTPAWRGPRLNNLAAAVSHANGLIPRPGGNTGWRALPGEALVLVAWAPIAWPGPSAVARSCWEALKHEARLEAGGIGQAAAAGSKANTPL